MRPSKADPTTLSALSAIPELLSLSCSLLWHLCVSELLFSVLLKSLVFPTGHHLEFATTAKYFSSWFILPNFCTRILISSVYPQKELGKVADPLCWTPHVPALDAGLWNSRKEQIRLEGQQGTLKSLNRLERAWNPTQLPPLPKSGTHPNQEKSGPNKTSWRWETSLAWGSSLAFTSSNNNKNKIKCWEVLCGKENIPVGGHFQVCVFLWEILEADIG